MILILLYEVYTIQLLARCLHDWNTEQRGHVIIQTRLYVG